MHGAVRHGEEVALAKALHGSPVGKATWWGPLSLCLSFSTDATRKLRWKRTNLNRAARTPTASAACGPASLRGAARLGQDNQLERGGGRCAPWDLKGSDVKLAGTAHFAFCKFLALGGE